jgi:predicted DNA-binding helix-hairpin-helix protein
MQKEKDVDGVVIVGLLSGIIMMAVSAVVGIIWIIKVIITKKAIYKCAYCKNVFETPVFMPSFTTEDLLHMVRKD